MQTAAVTVAVHSVYMKMMGKLRHNIKKAAAVYRLRVKQYKRLQIIWYFIILKAGIMTCLDCLNMHYAMHIILKNAVVVNKR